MKLLDVKRVTGSVQPKSGCWYAVLYYTDLETGERKYKWKKIAKINEKNRNGGMSAKRAEEKLQEMIAELNALQKAEIEKLSKFEGMTETELHKYHKRNMDFYECVVDNIFKRKNTLSPSTYNSYLTIANAQIKQFFHGKYRLCDIETIVINNFYSYCSEKGLKNSTIKRYRSLMNFVLDEARKEKVLPENPVADSNSLSSTLPHINPFNRDEAAKLMKGIGKMDDDMNIVIALGLLYGLRRSEIVGLKWSSIDFENKTISLTTSILEVPKTHEEETIKKCKGFVKLYRTNGSTSLIERDLLKSEDSIAVFPLFDLAEELLLKQKERIEANKLIFGNCYDKRFYDFVCVGTDGTLLRPNYITDHFGVVLKRIGLRYIKFHALRHTTGTLLMKQSGMNLKLIQQYLRHSESGITAKYYLHPDVEDIEQTGNIFVGTGIFDNVVNSNNTELERRKQIAEKVGVM